MVLSDLAVAGGAIEAAKPGEDGFGWIDGRAIFRRSGPGELSN